MAQHPIIILGAGGHAAVVADLLLQDGAIIGGYVAPQGELEGLDRWGSEDQLLAAGPNALVLANGIGSIGPSDLRQAVFERFVTAGFRFPALAHPRATIAANALLDAGCQVMANAVVQARTRIGTNSILNTASAIDHDCVIGAHVHIAPGATLSGNVTVGDGAHIGTGAVIIQGVTIGADALVAAGAVVVDDVPAGVRVKGCPARKF